MERRQNYCKFWGDENDLSQNLQVSLSPYNALKDLPSRHICIIFVVAVFNYFCSWVVVLCVCVCGGGGGTGGSTQIWYCKQVWSKMFWIPPLTRISPESKFAQNKDSRILGFVKVTWIERDIVVFLFIFCFDVGTEKSLWSEEDTSLWKEEGTTASLKELKFTSARTHRLLAFLPFCSFDINCHQGTYSLSVHQFCPIHALN